MVPEADITPQVLSLFYTIGVTVLAFGLLVYVLFRES